MKKITIYTTNNCPYCQMAKQLLSQLNCEYKEELLVGEELKQLKEKTKMMTVPQIFIEEELIGGYTELATLVSTNKFMEKIK